MKKYLRFIQMAFKTGFAYRTDYFVGIFRNLVLIVVQLAVWHALLGKTGQVVTNTGVVTFRDMSTYVLMSTLISNLITNNVILDIGNRIARGEISMDLIKPLNFQTYTFSSMIGQNSFNFLFQFLPIFAIGLVFVGIDFPTVQNFLLFCFTLINAIVIMFLITYSMALMTFWYARLWNIFELLQMIIRFFSGMLIPLWFFPVILVKISNYLPFKLIYFTPISIFLDKVGLVDCLYLVSQQFLWMAILFGVTQLVWRAAIKKLVIQGG